MYTHDDFEELTVLAKTEIVPRDNYLLTRHEQNKFPQSQKNYL